MCLVLKNYQVSPQSQIDHTMFHKHVGGKVTILIACVNDIIGIENNMAKIRNSKDSLAKFKI